MKVAYIHDWLITFAGAEKVLEAMLETIKGEKIYTLFYKPENFKNSKISEYEIETSPLNLLPGVYKYYRMLLPLMPLAVEWFNLGDYDLIISSNHAVAKGVIVFPHQKHICYTHTPIRYAWDLTYEYLNSVPKPLRPLAHALLHNIRTWDYITSVRVDVFIADSKTVAKRIKRYYGRDSVVIYPPVDVEKFRVNENHGDYFITVSRLVPYKKVDLLVEAFNELGLKFLVVGDGPEMGRIKRIAGKNVEVLGWVEEKTLIELLSNARAFVYAAYEDFGISPVEAMASGLPVIAYGYGGTSETVINGETGLFFYEQTPNAVIDAIKEFLKVEDKFDRKRIREHSLRFGRERFKREFAEVVNKAVENSSYDKV
ncbi:MAG: glycosyltransferase [candidate division WOR-3 bacterium]